MRIKRSILGWGVGFTILVVSGIVVIAQRESSEFSLERFRAPQFLVRDPSAEDRPVVEIVSSENMKDDPSFNDNSLLDSKQLQEPLLFRVPQEIIARPVIGARSQLLPERLSVDQFRNASWEMQEWVPYYRDQFSMESRKPQAQLVVDETQDIIQPVAILPRLQLFQNATLSLRGDSRGESESLISDLSFMDSSRIGLRSVEPVEPEQRFQVLAENETRQDTGLRFRETAPVVRSETGAESLSSQNWASLDQRKLKSSDSNNATPNEFNLRSSQDDPLQKQDGFNSTSEESVSLAQLKKEKEDQLRKPEEDRRFSTVEGSRYSLYADQGRKRLYEAGYRIGKFDVRAGLENQFVFNDNIDLTPNKIVSTTRDVNGNIVSQTTQRNPKKEEAAYLITTPIVELAAGERDPEITDALYLAFRYSPSLNNFIYSQKGSQSMERRDTFNQALAFNTGYRFSKLGLVFDQQVSDYSGGDLEAGAFVTRSNYNTNFSWEYAFTEKTSIDGSNNVNLRVNKDGFDSQEYSTKMFANYAWSEKLKVGLGGGLATLANKGGGDQNSYQGLMRALYFYSPKTSFFVEGGGELRTFEDFRSQVDLVFRSGGSYQITPYTSLTANTSRRQQAAGFNVGENLVVTGIDMSVVHTVNRLGLTTGFNVDYIDYNPNQKNIDVPRKEIFYSIRSGVRYEIMDWWDLGLEHNYRFNNSNTDTREFEVNQFNLNSKVRF